MKRSKRDYLIEISYEKHDIRLFGYRLKKIFTYVIYEKDGAKKVDILP